MTHAKFDGPLPDGWTGGDPVTKKYGESFLHLYRVYRPCKTCGTRISLDVTANALTGKKKNAGLAMKNCPTCRAVRKDGGLGSRGGTSRPMTDGAPETDTERLLSANRIMREEIDGLYVQNRELRDRLAKYELPEAMKQVAKNKMPWE